MALTATATSETQSFIVNSLSMNEPVVISQSLNRPNIFFSASGIKSLDVSIQSIGLNFIVIVQYECRKISVV